MSSSPWMTRQEVAAYLRVSPKTVDRYVREGKLTKHQVGDLSSPRLRRTEVEALVTPADGYWCPRCQSMRALREDDHDARCGCTTLARAKLLGLTCGHPYPEPSNLLPA